MSAITEEVWALLRELIQSQKETAQLQKETVQWQKETDQKFQEIAQRFEATDQKFQEIALEFQETGRETDRRLRELGKQIGGLGEKFGSFTEGLALPSMEKILRRYFKMEVINPSVRVTKNGRHLELDVMSYANGPINSVCVVEVKSHLREEAIGQLKKILSEFREFFPEHRDKRLYGILAAVDVSDMLREKVLNEGLYMARIYERVFNLDVPKGFQPKEF